MSFSLANIKGADQPAHPRRLIDQCLCYSLLERIVAKLAADEFTFL